MDSLRDEIAGIIERKIRVRVLTINGIQTAAVDDLNIAADAVLAIPRIKEALETHERVELCVSMGGGFVYPTLD
jgi:hypothetical protein